MVKTGGCQPSRNRYQGEPTRLFFCALICIQTLWSVDGLSAPQGAESTSFQNMPSGQTCVILRQIQVQDDPLSPRRRRNLLQPFIGACLSPERIRKILSVLTEAYLKEGWVTTRPYLTDQKIQNGILNIRVLQGRIDSVRSQTSGHSSLRIRNAFWGQKGSLLDLNRLESSLERMNRASHRKNSF
ncbi:MAG: ShlB/FhaC/HecB family hemolysin secretion/activation protein, partial [Gammaproteobacteria bacterium]